MTVDVDTTAKELISLLKKASKFQAEWRQSSIVKQMIVRYYRFMQLKASNPPNILLVPTLDIEMIWQTHLLRPSMYKNDCLRLFHRVIDHSLLTDEVEQFLKEKAFHGTCQLYEQRFGEKYCPLPSPNDENVQPKYVHWPFSPLKCVIPIYLYWDKTNFQFSNEVSPNQFENPFSFTEADVILDGNWLDLCERFWEEAFSTVEIHQYYRSKREIDLSNGSILRLKKSYERFLYLSAKYPPTDGYDFVHPTYAVRSFFKFFH